MTPLELIGTATTAYIQRRVRPEQGDEGTARLLLDRLTAAQVAAVCRSILSNPHLACQVQIRIPRDIGAPQDLPAEVLTDERTTHWRHAPCEKPILLLANSDDDQGQSLREVTPIDSTVLCNECDLWIDEASEGLGLVDQDITVWKRATHGLLDARPVSLDVFAAYVLSTREAIRDHGLPVVMALGWALPQVQVPRHSAFFNAIPEKSRTHVSQWKRLFQQAFTRYAPYLRKLTPTQQAIPTEQLREAWVKIQADIADQYHPTVEAFIEAPNKWTPESEALSLLEWEQDNIHSLFDGLRAQRIPLGTATIEFFDDTYPDALTEDEIEYLRRLDSRNTREPNDEDTEFYNRHRTELSSSRSLKAKWDKFVFGQPIEADDFHVGLLRALERLFEQAGPAAGARRLIIESHRQNRADWREMNTDAVTCFSRRYRGLHSLLRRDVSWQVGDLFSYERILERERARGRFQPNTSVAKAANHIKFYIRLECGGSTGQSYATQLLWSFNPNGICSQMPSDWERLLEHPFLLSRVSREPVSKKGKLQAIDLEDVSTFEPVFRQERGSLIPRYDREKDLALLFPSRLEDAKRSRRITEEGYEALARAWQAFVNTYGETVRVSFDQGASAVECLSLEPIYGELLQALIRHAPGDGNRQTLWQPLLSFGIVSVDGGSPAAIVAPWHPLRLLARAIKTRQLAGLVKHLVHADTVDFGDARVFFNDLSEEMRHPYYPEVCVGMYGSEPLLLCRTDSSGDYTLMEPAVASSAEDDATNENPSQTSGELLKLVQEYLSLQPHEAANLSLVLFNCNSARLPQSTVNALGALYEEDEEVRCQIILRHHNPQRLHELYEKLLEGSDASDDLIASEASRDFMARLRIGIMAESAPIPAANDGPPDDVVFLQDVVARLAEQGWLPEPKGIPIPEMIHHVPPRWSRRRPSTRDDLRSVVYLTCPSQPAVGRLYLQALYSLTRSADVDANATFLPVRQISFQHNSVREIFEETHRLGQWVVNCDDLLTRRLLRNQGVQVIRHRQQRYSERSITISSKAPLNLLDVMVQRRLQSLALGLSESELRDLTRRFVEDATEISGDIVLRAAKRGQFANELIGLVLSRFLLRSEIGDCSYCGWYFLDDYASWLGQKEEHLADIIALSPRRTETGVVLKVLLGEAKYVGSDALAKSRRISAVQLRETMKRVQDALFGNPGRLDRNLWLSRLADMILDGVEIPATQGDVLHEWREAIRMGQARVLLKGYSHIFTHTQNPSDNDLSERVGVPPLHLAWQEVYGRDRVRDLVLAYARNQSPIPTRQALGDDAPWTEGEPMLPTRPVLWTAVPREATRAHNGNGGGNGPPPNGGSSPPAPPQSPPLPPPLGPASSVGSQQPGPTQNQQHPDSSSLGDASGQRAPVDTDFPWALPTLKRTLASLAAHIERPEADAAWLQQTEAKLRTALLGYDLQAKVVGRRLTPNAALIRLQGSDRMRVTDVEQRRRELLTTHGLSVTNVLAEPGQVVVSIARPNREVISLVDAWRTRKVDDAESRANQSLLLGVKESDGELLYLRPGQEHAPHSLIAGTTGSGKSVLIQNLLLDIAATNSAHSAKIVLIDPKQGADYLDFQDLPHLEGGITVTQQAAQTALENAVAEMDDRYAMFRRAHVPNITSYNAQVSPNERIPVKWLVHDEFAVWMLTDTYKDMVSSTVQRLGVMARAAGVFLIFAAQRPEDRVMPLQLRDNLGNRLVLRVESTGTSVIALGEEGAERLLGKGHLAAKLQGHDRTILAQVPILTSEQIRSVVSSIVDSEVSGGTQPTSDGPLKTGHL